MIEFKRGRKITSLIGTRMRWKSHCGTWCIERTDIEGHGTLWAALMKRNLVHYDGAEHPGWGWADGHPVRYRTRAAAERAVDRAAMQLLRGGK